MTQRLECLINLFSERPSAVVLPFENPEIKFTNPDFSDFRSQCLEMTDFVFPSFDHQINAAAEMCLEREVTHLELLNKNRVITTRHSNLSSNGHIVFHLFADKIRLVYEPNCFIPPTYAPPTYAATYAAHQMIMVTSVNYSKSRKVYRKSTSSLTCIAIDYS